MSETMAKTQDASDRNAERLIALLVGQIDRDIHQGVMEVEKLGSRLERLVADNQQTQRDLERLRRQ